MNNESEHQFAENEAKQHAEALVIKRILQEGMDKYLKSLPESEKAFEEGEHKLCCIDEGTPMGDFRSAGSGILTEGEDRKAFIEALKKSGVESVTSHEGCGAAALYKEQKGITDKTVSEVAIEGAKKLAEELGVPYSGHIEELTRPMGHHTARVVYVDGTGHFNPSKVDGIPQGFVISRKLMTPEQSALEVSIALQIAFGDHGLGNKINQSEPLMVIVIGNSEDSEFSAQGLQAEIDSLLEKRATENPDDVSRIRVDSFSAPPEEALSLAA